MAKPNAPAQTVSADAPMATAATETTASAAPAASTPTNVLPFKIKVLKQVSTNLLKLRAGDECYVTITGKMEKAQALKKQSAEDAKKEPPTLIPVINLLTGEIQSIIAGSVLVDLLNDQYPKDTYVGKSFHITLKVKKAAQGGGGRSYNTYDVVEIAVEK
jgi:hypothetical protein